MNDDVDGLWDNPNNWSDEDGGVGGAGVPGPGNDVYFTGSETSDCRFDAALDVASISAVAAYTGHLDAAQDDLDHAISGDLVLANPTFSMGDGAWTCSGTWDLDITTLNPGAGKLILDGTSKQWKHHSNSDNASTYYDVEIATGATISIP
ncbi:MAG: hypothetical protein JRC90_11160, partial [Deltaproteobacteria bacterium]|nr:hypothetical protein [Deltaproteobacteria bacterium]